MKSLLTQEHEEFTAAKALVSSDQFEEQWKGVEKLMLLALHGKTAVSAWAETILRDKYKTDLARDLLDATATKTNSLS